MEPGLPQNHVGILHPQPGSQHPYAQCQMYGIVYIQYNEITASQYISEFVSNGGKCLEAIFNKININPILKIGEDSYRGQIHHYPPETNPTDSSIIIQLKFNHVLCTMYS